MILETVVSTYSKQHGLNLSPMGVEVTDDFDWQNDRRDFFQLKPFHPSRTRDNLQDGNGGVLHLIDDVELFANAALYKKDEKDEWLARQPVKSILNGDRFVLAQSCVAVEFKTVGFQQLGNRWHIQCQAETRHYFRPFVGFNRAAFAVLELTILATRIDWLPEEVIDRQMDAFASLIEKTGGCREKRAWDFVIRWIRDQRLRPVVENKS